MKYILTRTSNYDEEKPLEDKRVYEEEINCFIGDKATEKVWVIDINSLDELNDFIKENGKIVIEPYYSNKYYMELEIYDFWRE